MPTYEYECAKCGHRFEQDQSINDPPLTKCPECKGRVKRVVSGGAGFIMKGSHHGAAKSGGACSLETTGRTCCGRDSRCSDGSCD